MTSVVVKRDKLPSDMLEWLETEGLDQSKAIAVILTFDGRKDLIVQRLGDVDPTMMARVRAASARYHSALERLADS